MAYLSICWSAAAEHRSHDGRTARSCSVKLKPSSRLPFKPEVTVFTPLRYQATQADCYPTSVLNALIWLFERHELPGAILQHIYAYCLDGIERGLAGSYTSEHASLALVDWLEEFKTRSFAVATKIIKGRDLHLRPSSEVLRWLRRGGVAVLDVCDTTATTHSILALAEGADHLGFWDPYIRGARYDYGRAALRLETDGHSPNLRLIKSWLDSPRTRRYSFGPLANRVSVLIRRTKPGRRHSSAGNTALRLNRTGI